MKAMIENLTETVSTVWHDSLGKVAILGTGAALVIYWALSHLASILGA